MKGVRIQIQRRSVRRVRLDDATLMKREPAGHTEEKCGEIKNRVMSLSERHL